MQSNDGRIDGCGDDEAACKATKREIPSSPHEAEFLAHPIVFAAQFSP
jgi:hypothetical protein